MNTITVCFNDATKEDVEKADGIILSVSCNGLLKTIEDQIRLRPDEVINGLVVNDVDIWVNIGRKKGRKRK